MQPDGKIVVAGTVSTAVNSDFFVWRINPNGTYDRIFGGRVVTASFADSDSAVSVFVRPNGKILVAGLTFNLTTFKNDFAFAKFNSDGSPDISFNGNGKKITARGDDGFSIPFDFEMQPDGKIVGVGTIVTSAAESDASFAITRFDAEGNLDAAFGSRFT